MNRPEGPTPITRRVIPRVPWLPSGPRIAERMAARRIAQSASITQIEDYAIDHRDSPC